MSGRAGYACDSGIGGAVLASRASNAAFQHKLAFGACLTTVAVADVASLALTVARAGAGKVALGMLVAVAIVCLAVVNGLARGSLCVHLSHSHGRKVALSCAVCAFGVVLLAMHIV